MLARRPIPVAKGQKIPHLETWELILRVAAAGTLGGLIGFEREFHEHAAGFRTHILVSMGAALFTLVGAYGVESFAGAGDGIRVTFDPTRVAAQVVTGIGFLGAGAIMRQGVNVRGLTTAAALWVTAAIGTAVALGYWVGAIATAVGALIALTALRWIENFVFPRLRADTIRFIIEAASTVQLSRLAEVIEGHGARAESIKLISDEEGNRHMSATVQLPEGLSSLDLAREIEAVEGIERVDVSHKR